MSTLAILGCLWGDEAKAKVVDYLGASADVVVRFQGGANAGHTIVVEGRKYVFHSVPAGILYPNCNCVIGSGVVVDPFRLRDEMRAVQDSGINFVCRLFIDERASMVLPLHQELYQLQEKRLGEAKIGTTGRGIGPAYADRVSRRALRLIDLAHPEWQGMRLQALYEHHQIQLEDLEAKLADLQDVYEFLKPYLAQTDELLWDWYLQDKHILFEGAQGTLLDLVYGSYPYVTSSQTISGSISVGTGLTPRCINKIIGVYKAYGTRVGEGPFPTEIEGETGDLIRKQGNEYGATTGRPRRVGWFDAVAAVYTARLNGLDGMALTLLDVLGGIGELKICTGYWLEGKRVKGFLSHHLDLARVQPEYLTLPGWDVDISSCTSLVRLPKAAKDYLDAVQDLVGTQIELVSVGPDRKQTIVIY